VAADLLDVELHGFGIRVRQGERCSDASCRTDGAKETGTFIALIGGLSWPCSALRPLPDKAVLLADPSFVLKPYLDRRLLWKIGEMSA